MRRAFLAVVVFLVGGAPAHAQDLAGTTVAIDPGHNGANGAHPDRINRHVAIGGGQTKACDTTGTATASGYSEASYTLAVARELRRILVRNGAEVVMTRTTNSGVGPCINRRARIGNRAGADAAVSIHADGGPSGGRGFHVIYPTRIAGLTDDIFGASRRLARSIRREYGARSGLPPATYLGGDGLVARSDLGGLRLSDVPKVFVETGNMRNAADAAVLESRRGRNRIARGIYEGLLRFVSG
jgi:N-acetylmuramoyl-L-alanine amidase